MLAGGAHGLATDQARRLRAAAADDLAGPALRRRARRPAGRRVRGRGRAAQAGADRAEGACRTTTRGQDLLTLKTLFAVRTHGPAPWLHTPEVVDVVRRDWRAVQPLLRLAGPARRAQPPRLTDAVAWPRCRNRGRTAANDSRGAPALRGLLAVTAVALTAAATRRPRRAAPRRHLPAPPERAVRAGAGPRRRRPAAAARGPVRLRRRLLHAGGARPGLRRPATAARSASCPTRGAALPLHFQATRLGEYLLATDEGPETRWAGADWDVRTFVAAPVTGTARPSSTAPSTDAEWRLVAAGDDADARHEAGQRLPAVGAVAASSP